MVLPFLNFYHHTLFGLADRLASQLGMEKDNSEPSVSNPADKSGTSGPKSTSSKKGASTKVKSSSGPSSSGSGTTRRKKPKSTPLDSEQIKVIQSEIQSQLSPLVAKLDLLLAERPPQNSGGTLVETDNSLEAETLEVRAPEQDSLYGSPTRDSGRQNWRLSSDKEGLEDYTTDMPSAPEDCSVTGESSTTEEVPSSFIELIEGVMTI